MKIPTAVFYLALGAIPVAVAFPLAQAPAPPKPVPAETAPAAGPRAREAVSFNITEVESLKLQVAQKDAVIAQIQWQTAVGRFNAEIKAVHDAHGWPDSVVFNPNSMNFAGPPDAMDKPAPAAPDMTKPTGPPVEPAKAK
jgi:hypothetical protein